MNTENFKRRLAAILSADVKGYSRLMRDDEEATIRTLTTYRDAMTNLIQHYRGRVVDSPGDNLLAEFGSVVDAVSCAVEVQRELAERNAELPENRRMPFRIGVNLGDVIEEGERIYGDGINIAARMEGLAEGGGICISGTVYDAIEKKIGLEHEYLGEQEIKNIDKPVRAYRVLSYPGAAAHRVVKAKRAVGKTWRNVVLAIVAVLILGGGALAVWHFYLRPAPPPAEVASEKTPAPKSPDETPLPVPAEPSIAVLPFANISGDPKQDYLCDGITEQIITTLSRVPNIYVIARNSVFTYKGKPVKVQQVRQELGVEYVLEGSCQRSGDRLRITAQLIDATTGRHIWSEHYDRNLKDLFSLQDEIALTVLKGMKVEVMAGLSCAKGGTTNVDAFIKAVQGLHHRYLNTMEDHNIAKKYYKEAIALDPKFTNAYVLLGWVHVADIVYGFSESKEESMARADKFARKALALDDTWPFTYSLLGFINCMKGQHEKAVAQAQRAVELAPNSASELGILTFVLDKAGRPEEAIIPGERAVRLDPNTAWIIDFLGDSYRKTGRYKEAINAYKKVIQRAPNRTFAHAGLAVCYIKIGQEGEASKTVKEMVRLNPKMTLEHVEKTVRDREKNKASAESYIAALRKAGLK